MDSRDLSDSQKTDRDNVITHSPKLLRRMIGINGSNQFVKGTYYDMVETRSRFSNHSLNEIPLRGVD